MSYSYMEIIANGMHIPIEDVSNIPLNIALVDTNYSMAFIDCENDDCLGINYTIEDGTEHFVAVNKLHIIDVAVIYQQDVDLMNKVSKQNDDDFDVMFG